MTTGKPRSVLQPDMADDALVQDGVDGLAVVGGPVGVAVQRGALGGRIAHGGSLPLLGPASRRDAAASVSIMT